MKSFLQFNVINPLTF